MEVSTTGTVVTLFGGETSLFHFRPGSSGGGLLNTFRKWAPAGEPGATVAIWRPSGGRAFAGLMAPPPPPPSRAGGRGAVAVALGRRARRGLLGGGAAGPAPPSVAIAQFGFVDWVSPTPRATS